MADSVNRIVPSTVAPERHPIARRDRDERNKREPRQRNPDKPRGFPISSAANPTPAGEHDKIVESNRDKTKGKILDISA